MREVEHRAVIIHVDGDLLTRLGMQDRECGTDRDGVIAFIPCAKEGTYDTLLGICAAEIVVEDREEGGGVDGDRGSPTASCVKKTGEFEVK